MGKRSSFPRRERQLRHTIVGGPAAIRISAATHEVLRTLSRREQYLCGHLTAAGHVLVGSSDEELDARTTQYRIPEDSVFITNPPWDRPTLHAILTNLSNQAPAWLLIDADWAHTRQSIPYLPSVRTIVATGRHRSIPGTKFTSKDNACWHLTSRGLKRAS